jgi:TIR domain
LGVFVAQIFLSYAHQNRVQVAKIAEGLEAEGFSLWWDQRLHAGDEFTSDIESALDGAKCVVVVWSAAARNSLWVRAEANAGLEQDKLLQVAAENVRPPLPFTMLQLLDLQGWNGERTHAVWRELGDSVGAVIAGGGVHERNVEAKRAPQSLFAPMVAVGAGSIGLTLLVSALSALMAQAPQEGDGFGLLSLAAFASACLGLGYMLMRTIQIGLASRRAA